MHIFCQELRFILLDRGLVDSINNMSAIKREMVECTWGFSCELMRDCIFLLLEALLGFRCGIIHQGITESNGVYLLAMPLEQMCGHNFAASFSPTSCFNRYKLLFSRVLYSPRHQHRFRQTKHTRFPLSALAYMG